MKQKKQKVNFISQFVCLSPKISIIIALFKCKFPKNKSIDFTHLKKIKKISYTISVLPTFGFFFIFVS